MAIKGSRSFRDRMLEFTLGIEGHVAGSTISGASISGIYTVKDQHGDVVYAKGVMGNSSADGLLNVRLVNDYDSSNAEVYCLLPVGAGVTPAIFDKVKLAGTTVTLTDIILAL